MRIVDEDEKVLAAEQTGEIQVHLHFGLTDGLSNNHPISFIKKILRRFQYN